MGVWLKDNNGSAQVDLDLVHEPWPERPRRVYSRAASSQRMVPGLSGTAVTPGRTVHFDAGSNQSAGIVEIIVPYVDDTKLATLELKWFKDPVEPVLYSPDSGANVWRLAWADGESFVPEPMPGFPGKFKLTMRFNIIEKTV